jgi:Asp-tRNA(Asn)/Glu-tRNA(Gln) amidotransferase A subunit family amidase
MPKHLIFIEHSITDLIAGLGVHWSSQDLLRMSLENINGLNTEYSAWVRYRDVSWKSPGRGNPTDGHEKSPGLFSGIPIGVKDIYNTYDFPTEMGSDLWKGHLPGNDARAVYNLKHEGAMVIGKTVTAEFAVHALKDTRNPWDKTKTPGTSSSGSAVAISMGMVPFATASQTAGSIIRPASFTGIYGFKPSFGLIPRTGTLKTTDSLDTLGCMAIHHSDIRRGFEAMRVRGLDYPISDPALNDPSRRKAVNRPWKIAFAKTHVWDLAPSYAQDAITLYLDSLARGTDFEVIDAHLPERLNAGHTIHERIYEKSLAYYFKREYTDQEQISEVMRMMIARGASISVESYRQALLDQEQIIRDMDDYLSTVDVIISLSTSGEAPPRDQTEAPDPCLIWTLAHLPALNVPLFKSPNGLPFGLQVVARKYSDYNVLDFVDALVAKGYAPRASGFAVEKKE